MTPDQLAADFKARTGKDIGDATLADLRAVLAAHLAEADQHDARIRDLQQGTR